MRGTIIKKGIVMTKQEFEQEQYERVLSTHWQKLVQLKELAETSSGSALRRTSIEDRQKELLQIDNQKLVLEQLSDWLVVPEWYTNKIKELRWELQLKNVPVVVK